MACCVLAHALDVLGQRDQLLAALGRVEAQQRQQVVLGAPGPVATPSLRKAPNSFQKVRVALGVLLGQLSSSLISLRDQRPLDAPRRRVALHRLAGDVQRQVLRLDHALDEAQIVGQQVLVVLLDQHVVDVELEAVVGARAERAPLAAGRARRGCCGCRPARRSPGGCAAAAFRKSEGQVLVELVVLLVRRPRWAAGATAPSGGWPPPPCPRRRWERPQSRSAF